MFNSLDVIESSPSALKLSPDRCNIHEAINTLVPNGNLTLTAIHPSKGMKDSHTFNIPTQLDKASTWAVERNQSGCNVYWAPNISAVPHAKAKASDITSARFMWADIDPKVTKFATFEQARDDLLQRVLPRLKKIASAVIDSGNGLQALFRLNQDVDLTDPKTREKYLAINEFAGTKLGGPGTHNADRILRLPGTLNYPNHAKLAKGYPEMPSVSCLLHVSDNKFSPNLPDDYSGTESKPKEKFTLSTDHLAEKLKMFLENNISAKDRYSGSVHGLNDSSGSGLDMSMLAMMKTGGFTLDETKELLKKWQHGSINGRQQGERYWRRMWEKADSPLNLAGESMPYFPQELFASLHVTDKQERYTLKTVGELKAMPPASWCIKGVLPKHGLASIFGASGSGKTFLVLDLGVSISSGRDWFNHTTAECPVVYVALEGAGGITNRLKAWEAHNGKLIPDNFRVVTDHLSLFKEGDIEHFAEVVLAHSAGGGVIFIDTLNQSAPEADENTSKDMGRIISRAMRLKELTNSLVVLVHHTGKDAGKGLRGHSSLNAALDAAIEVRKDINGRAWTLAKSKDGVDDVSNRFMLKSVTLGKDSDGDDITSCVVEPDFMAAYRTEPKEPKGTNQKIALREIKALLQTATTQPGHSQIRIKSEEAISAIGSVLHIDPKRKRERAESAIMGLVAADIITQKDGLIWLS